MDKIERMKELIPVLQKAGKAYYQEDREIMSNFEYDKLYDELETLEKETGITLAGSPTVSVGYSFILYLLGVIQVFGGYVASIFTLVGSAYQYGHASEKMDGVRIESDIENFDKF